MGGKGGRGSHVNRARRQIESRQALRAVVRNPHTADLPQRTVRLNGVAHQFRGIPVNLVEIGAIRGHPAIARAATDVATKRPEGAVSGNSRARWILRYGYSAAVDVEGRQVAVTEVGRVHRSVVRRNAQPAQFGGPAHGRIDLYYLTDRCRAVLVGLARCNTVTDGISDDEG